MAKVIEGLYYSESHEFVRVEGNFGFVGITDYAQHALGNVVYVDMPEVDDEVTAGEEFGAVVILYCSLLSYIDEFLQLRITSLNRFDGFRNSFVVVVIHAFLRYHLL